MAAERDHDERPEAAAKGEPPLRVAIDYRPALYSGFGIGRYVSNLVRAMLEEDPALELRLYGVFLRGRRQVLAQHDWPDPRRAKFCGFPMPARLVPRLARCLPISARSFCGPFDLFHDTDYAVTPVGSRPRIATIHDAAYLRERGYVSAEQSEKMRGIVERLLRGVDHVLTLSEFSKGDLVEAFNMDPDHITVAHLGVDQVFLEEPQGEAIAATMERYGVDDPYAVYIGTLEPRKNLVRLVRAFAQLLEVEPEYRLLLIGRKGWAAERVFDEIERQGVSRSVQWLGVIPDEDVVHLLKGASMLAYPSLYEGFGLPALEGMAAGVPVLSSDSHALREVCGDGALLVDPTSESEIFEGMRTLALDRGEAHEIAARGKARAREFSWRGCARKTLDAYRGVLRRRI